jgi:hypothetical protein
MSKTKKTVNADVVIVNSVMWAEGVGKGWKGVRVKGWRSSYQARDHAEWMGIHHHEQDTGPPSNLGFLIISAGVLINNCLYIV